MIAKTRVVRCKSFKIYGVTHLKTSAGKKGVDGEKLSRRLELVRDLRLAPERSPRRFRIGLADDLFSNTLRAKEASQSTEPDLRMESETAIHSEEQPAFPQTELLVGLAAIAGLTLGYLLGKRHK